MKNVTLLQAIAGPAARPLKWSKSGLLKREYQLAAGDAVVGTLRFRGAMGTMALAECGAGSWTIKRTGFWQTQVTVRAAGAETDLAVFRNKTWSGGGVLEFGPGRKFRLTNKTWQTHYQWRTEADEVLCGFKPGGWSQQTAEVEVSPPGAATPELALLLMVGWYIAIMTQSDAASMGVG